MFSKDPYYSAKEVLQEYSSDLSIMRRRPESFRVSTDDGRELYLICAPVMYFEHPEFLRDLVTIMEKNYEIFQKIEFLSAEEFKDKDALSRFFGQFNIFDNSDLYEAFVCVDVPAFIQKWSKTIAKKDLKKWQKNRSDKVRFIKPDMKYVREFLSYLHTEEVLYIFSLLFIFNFDIVKKKTFDFLARLRTGSSTNTTCSGSSTGSAEASAMPTYSSSRFSKSDLQLFALQSHLN